jgi:hypothetical protein
MLGVRFRGVRHRFRLSHLSPFYNKKLISPKHYLNIYSLKLPADKKEINNDIRQKKEGAG